MPAPRPPDRTEIPSRIGRGHRAAGRKAPGEPIEPTAYPGYPDGWVALRTCPLGAQMTRTIRTEPILVTDPDRVVAELGPIRETRSPVLADAFLAEAVRSGVLTPPALAGSGPPPRPAPVSSLDEVPAELDESRRDR